MKKLQVWVDEEVLKRLGYRAVDEGTTVAAIVRSAIVEHLGTGKGVVVKRVGEQVKRVGLVERVEVMKGKVFMGAYK